MGNMEDVLLHDMELIPEDTSDADLKGLMIDTLNKLDVINSEIQGLKILVTSQRQVNKNYGRKRCKMYYQDKLISDKELVDLRKQIPTAEILKDFKYINEYNEIILGYGNSQSKQLCRNMIANRTR